MRCFQTLRRNISNTRWSVSSDIQSLRSITSNTSSILSYIQTPTRHVTNARVFQENLANIQTPQEIILISKSRRNVSSVILLREKFLQFDWLRAVVFQLNLKYLHVKITNLL